VLHQVGAGTLGPVFRAHDPVEGRLVAVKAFRLDLIPERAAAFAGALDTLASRSLDHPSIATPIAAGVEGTAPWLAQAYVPAESLDSALRQYGTPPLADALAIVTQLAGALDFAAAAGVLHGALHPRDVLVAPDDTRVIDLGVAAALEGVGLRAPVRRPFAAPERIAGGPVSRAADIFALGAISFELVTGRRVTGAGEEAVAELPDIPGANREALVDTFAFALSAAPDERFTTALGFVAALKRALGDAALHAPPMIGRDTVAAPVADVAASGAPAGPGEPFQDARDEPIVVPPVAARPQPRAPRAKSVRPEQPDSPELPALTPALAESAPAPEIAEDKAAAVAPALPLEEVAFRPPEAEHPGRWDAHDEPPPVQPAMRNADHARPPAASPPVRARGMSVPILAAMFVLGALAGLGLAWVFFVRPAGPAVTTASTASSTSPASEPPAAVPPPAESTPTPARAGNEGTATQVEGPSTSAAAPAVPPTTSVPAPTPAAPPAKAATKATSPAKSRQPAAPARGQLAVRSTPAGARVEVNGRMRGQTPLTLHDLPLGALSVRVIRDGYKTEQRRVTLTASRASQSLEVPLAASAAASGSKASPDFVGSVLFETRPAGARVFLDGRQIGTTPTEVPKVAAGSHVVRLELTGFKRWSASVTVVAGERNRVAASLEEEEVR